MFNVLFHCEDRGRGCEQQDSMTESQTSKQGKNGEKSAECMQLNAQWGQQPVEHLECHGSDCRKE